MDVQHFMLVEGAELLLHLPHAPAPSLAPDQSSELAGNPPCSVPRDLHPAQTHNRLRVALDLQTKAKPPCST